jgi:uncharacterized SAM-binding protein YcdF (DUF218 family)
MRKKWVAKHSQALALLMLFLGLIFSLFGLFTFFPLLLGIPLLLLGLYMASATRRLWVCRSCGAAIERQGGINLVPVLGGTLAVVVILGAISVFTALRNPPTPRPPTQDTRGGRIFTRGGSEIACDRIIEVGARVQCDRTGTSFGVQRDQILRIERR